MIVVASLIDKAPNLAGLCRTCEVFNVRKLIISDLKYLKDPTFLSMSVTAEKWIDIQEVHPAALKRYLSKLKSKQ